VPLSAPPHRANAATRCCADTRCRNAWREAAVVLRRVPSAVGGVEMLVARGIIGILDTARRGVWLLVVEDMARAVLGAGARFRWLRNAEGVYDYGT
jgi:hypothetical protein